MHCEQGTGYSCLIYIFDARISDGLVLIAKAENGAWSIDKKVQMLTPSELRSALARKGSCEQLLRQKGDDRRKAQRIYQIGTTRRLRIRRHF